MSMTTRTALIFFAAGIFLFIVNYYLIKYHTRKAAAEGKRVKKKTDHIWGKNGKDGIVPVWVSYVGLLAFVSFFMGIFMFVVKGFLSFFS